MAIADAAVTAHELQEQQVGRILTLRRFIFCTLRSAGIGWLAVTMLVGQGGQLAGLKVGAHPLERFVQEANVAVDATVVTVEAILPGEGRLAPASSTPLAEAVVDGAGNLPAATSSPLAPGDDMGGALDLAQTKRLLTELTQRLAQWDDAPHRWELVTDLAKQYWAMRYEGRGFAGTHWIVSAHGLQGDDTVYVTVRAQFLGLPGELRPTIRGLKDVLRGKDMAHVEARVAVTGMARHDVGHQPVQYAADLLSLWGPGESTHVRQTGDGVWVSGYTPYLPAHGASNIEVHIVPHTVASRVTLASPNLHAADVVAADEGAMNLVLLATNGYTSGAGGQTMIHEVSGTW